MYPDLMRVAPSGLPCLAGARFRVLLRDIIVGLGTLAVGM